MLGEDGMMEKKWRGGERMKGHVDGAGNKKMGQGNWFVLEGEVKGEA